MQLIVYKGDDTDGTFGRHLSIIIKAPEGTSFEGCTAKFTVHGIVKSWTSIVSGTAVEIVYSKDETASMPLGSAKGTFQIVDSTGKLRTFDNQVPFFVTDDLSQVYPGTTTATMAIGGIVRYSDIVGRPDFTQVDPDTATLADVIEIMKRAN